MTKYGNVDAGMVFLKRKLFLLQDALTIREINFQCYYDDSRESSTPVAQQEINFCSKTYVSCGERHLKWENLLVCGDYFHFKQL